MPKDAIRRILANQNVTLERLCLEGADIHPPGGDGWEPFDRTEVRAYHESYQAPSIGTIAPGPGSQNRNETTA